MRKKTSGPVTPRSLKIGEELRHNLAAAMRDMGFLDPDLVDASITVTEVKIGADLKNATAYVMTLGGKNLPKVLKALNKHAKYFRSEIARNTHLKHTPAIKFDTDTSFDYAEKINKLIQQANH